MARNFAGGTDRIAFGAAGWDTTTVGCISFFIKTTQATANAVPLSIWTNSSRLGFGFILNNTANKLLLQCYAGTASVIVNLLSTANINDGVWHHVALNWNKANGGANTLYIDGAQDQTANASAVWSGTNSGTPLTLGDNNDTFWASYVGDIAELGQWFRNLAADEIAALAKGFSPKLFNGINLYAPFVRNPNNLRDSFITGPTGTTVSDHPRMMGGAV